MIDFLKALVRHIQRPLLIVWDRLPAHRSALVREFLGYSDGYIETEYLPAYAPELNPVEYLWGYWKQHELPNVCPKGLLGTRRPCSAGLTPYAQATPRRCLLEAVFFVLRLTEYYARLSRGDLSVPSGAETAHALRVMGCRGD